LSQLLKRITVPVMVIGADEEVRPARNRDRPIKFSYFNPAADRLYGACGRLYSPVSED
jgi:hypothetical protein